MRRNLLHRKSKGIQVAVEKPQRALWLRKAWYDFSRNRASVVGLAMVLIVIVCAVAAPIIATHPDHAGLFLDFKSKFNPPSLEHFFGTDNVGRDVFSRVIFAFRFSLLLGCGVLAIAVPVGTILGLIAGYYKGSIIDTVIMRTTDVFLSLPPLVLALTIASILTPNLRNALLAVSITWWPWYCRMIYSIVSSVRNEPYVRMAEILGAPRRHILGGEILPNCITPLFTKMTLDMGGVILLGASLSFVGLGVQPPTPGLGTMLSKGTLYLPNAWWLVIFPALGIFLVVAGFNLLGDGLRDILGSRDV